MAFVGLLPKSEKESQRCYPDANTLIVTRTNNPAKGLKVEMALEFNNGYGCGFEAEGFWWPYGQRIVARNEETQCEVLFIYAGGKFHTVTRSDEQCKAHCGSAGILDGARFSRSNGAGR